LRSRPLLERVEELGRLNRRHDAEESAWHLSLLASSTSQG